jgi:hypothetical protein
MRFGAMLCGAAVALLYFSLLVWTARDIAARSRDMAIRIGAVLLVLVLNVLGLVIYLMLRPRETVAERVEREMIEEILAREISAAAAGRAHLRSQTQSTAPPARPPEADGG